MSKNILHAVQLIIFLVLPHLSTSRHRPRTVQSHLMPLLDLTDDILDYIIELAGGSFPNRSKNSFSPAISRYEDTASLRAIGLTCSRLHQLAGTHLSSFLSLVRVSEIDALLAGPSRLNNWSEAAVYAREYFLEVLGDNFDACGAAELATLCCRKSILGDSKLKSRYQRYLSMNNFVTSLEILADMLSALEYFPRLAILKVMGHVIKESDTFSATGLLHLRTLCVNVEVLLASPALLQAIPLLFRIDMIADFNLLQSLHLENLALKFQNQRLRELNFFANCAEVLNFTRFLAILEPLDLEKLAIRLCRRGTLFQSPKFEMTGPAGPAVIGLLLKYSRLSLLIVDSDILSRLAFPQDYWPSRNYVSRNKDEAVPQRRFVLVEYSLTVPKLLFNPRQIVIQFIRALHISEFGLVYGEVIEQSHLHAIGILSNLVSVLATSSTQGPYLDVRRVSMEKAWSISEETDQRRRYESLNRDFGEARTSFRAIASASVRDRTLFTSPRYRKKEVLVVLTQGNVLAGLEPVPIMLPVCGDIPYDEDFWSGEASLRDLGHYSIREKKLSSIWY